MTDVDRILWTAEVAGWRFDVSAVAPLAALVADDAAVYSGLPRLMNLDQRDESMFGFPCEVLRAYLTWAVETAERLLS